MSRINANKRTKLPAVDTTLNAQHGGNDSAVSPGDQQGRKHTPRARWTLPQQAPWQQMQSNRRRTAELPKPTTREIVSDEETVMTDDEGVPHFASLPAPRSRPDHGPRRYPDAQTATARHTGFAAPERPIRYSDLLTNKNSIEKASIDLAYKMLAKEHDRQITKLGGKIYDSVSKVPNIDEALFDSDSEDSDFSDDWVAPPSPGPIRMQSWLYTGERLQDIVFAFMLIAGICIFFGQARHTRWMMLLMVLLILSWYFVFRVAAQQKKDRSASRRGLRSDRVKEENLYSLSQDSSVR